MTATLTVVHYIGLTRSLYLKFLLLRDLSKRCRWWDRLKLYGLSIFFLKRLLQLRRGLSFFVFNSWLLPLRAIVVVHQQYGRSHLIHRVDWILGNSLLHHYWRLACVVLHHDWVATDLWLWRLPLSMVSVPRGRSRLLVFRTFQPCLLFIWILIWEVLLRTVVWPWVSPGWLMVKQITLWCPMWVHCWKHVDFSIQTLVLDPSPRAGSSLFALFFIVFESDGLGFLAAAPLVEDWVLGFHDRDDVQDKIDLFICNTLLEKLIYGKWWLVFEQRA